MSSINFAPIQHEHPDLSQVAEEVERWLETHQGRRRLSLPTLVRDLEDKVRLVDLTRLLHELARKGVVKTYYAAVTPSGELSEDEYEVPDEVPDTMFDWFDRPFSVDRRQIVPVYRLR